MLGESVLKAETQQLSGVTVVSRGIVLQLPSGVSQSMLEHKCFPLIAFSKSWLCFYDQDAEVGWGTGQECHVGCKHC